VNNCQVRLPGPWVKPTICTPGLSPDGLMPGSSGPTHTVLPLVIVPKVFFWIRVVSYAEAIVVLPVRTMPASANIETERFIVSFIILSSRLTRFIYNLLDRDAYP
jgi:hypothetical protein